MIVNPAPYASHGPLHVSGPTLMDALNRPFQLRGLSTHGLAWFPQYVNEETFRYLRDEWHVNCIRLALYPDSSLGYETDGDRKALGALVRKGINIASSLGMYVIVDWHVLEEQDPLVHLQGARQFFYDLSREYANFGNILYEICNEPNGTGSWNNIQAYADQVIPVIRQNARQNIILVGTPNWSQEIDKALARPIAETNLMYTLHFYAATHGDGLRDRLERCVRAGLPVFISEFGICSADGNGSVDLASGNAWRTLIDRYNLSFICWNLSNKKEASSLIHHRCPKLHSFTENELAPQGRWIRDWLKSKPLP